MSLPYRTLFVGTLVQESFLSAGGIDDPLTTVDSPFCRDGQNRPTLRGTGLAGALIATLRRSNNGMVPVSISGSDKGRQPSVWRFFNSHPKPADQDKAVNPAYRQHVAIHEQTGAAATGALFNVETLPPGTGWPFLLEVDTSRDPEAADHARDALSHWAAGRCLLGREVARGLGWMRLYGCKEYTLSAEHVDHWPNARKSAGYAAYIRDELAAKPNVKVVDVAAAKDDLPGWIELTGTVSVGEHKVGNDVYGIDSLSIGGHASEELSAEWDNRFLAPDGMTADGAKAAFDPDFAVVTWESDGKRLPYIPGSSLRGPLRHALTRLLRARNEKTALADSLFGPKDCKQSAKLLIRDAFPTEGSAVRLAWLAHHAEDEFTAGAYGSSLFNRVAVMEGSFRWRMVLEDPSDEEQQALADVLALAQAGQIGFGGGQWRGHGWLRWVSGDWSKLAAKEENRHG